jgi:hypothetical protein
MQGVVSLGFGCLRSHLGAREWTIGRLREAGDRQRSGDGKDADGEDAFHSAFSLGI